MKFFKLTLIVHVYTELPKDFEKKSNRDECYQGVTYEEQWKNFDNFLFCRIFFVPSNFATINFIGIF